MDSAGTQALLWKNRCPHLKGIVFCVMVKEKEPKRRDRHRLLTMDADTRPIKTVTKH